MVLNKKTKNYKKKSFYTRKKKHGGFINKKLERDVGLLSSIKRELDNIDIESLNYALDVIMRESRNQILTVIDMKSDDRVIDDMYNDYGSEDLKRFIRNTIEITNNINNLYYLIALSEPTYRLDDAVFDEVN